VTRRTVQGGGAARGEASVRSPKLTRLYSEEEEEEEEEELGDISEDLDEDEEERRLLLASMDTKSEQYT
jgi:hypothetical protein